MVTQIHALLTKRGFEVMVDEFYHRHFIRVDFLKVQVLWNRGTGYSYWKYTKVNSYIFDGNFNSLFDSQVHLKSIKLTWNNRFFVSFLFVESMEYYNAQLNISIHSLFYYLNSIFRNEKWNSCLKNSTKKV